ncbi:MAG: hypothetical protein IJ679_13005, partial [Lachnospiraceae bacterium]|nr:hypothetical protein [Lachnospiraceae bacterium]
NPASGAIKKAAVRLSRAMALPSAHKARGEVPVYQKNCLFMLTERRRGGIRSKFQQANRPLFIPRGAAGQAVSPLAFWGGGFFVGQD